MATIRSAVRPYHMRHPARLGFYCIIRGRAAYVRYDPRAGDLFPRRVTVGGEQRSRKSGTGTGRGTGPAGHHTATARARKSVLACPCPCPCPLSCLLLFCPPPSAHCSLDDVPEPLGE